MATTRKPANKTTTTDTAERPAASGLDIAALVSGATVTQTLPARSGGRAARDNAFAPLVQLSLDTDNVIELPPVADAKALDKVTHAVRRAASALGAKVTTRTVTTDTGVSLFFQVSK